MNSEDRAAFELGYEKRHGYNPSKSYVAEGDYYLDTEGYEVDEAYHWWGLAHARKQQEAPGGSGERFEKWWSDYRLQFPDMSISEKVILKTGAVDAWQACEAAMQRDERVCRWEWDGAHGLNTSCGSWYPLALNAHTGTHCLSCKGKIQQVDDRDHGGRVEEEK